MCIRDSSCLTCSALPRRMWGKGRFPFMAGGAIMSNRSSRLRLDQLEDRTVPSSPGDVDWLRQFGSLLGLQAPDPARAVVVAGSNVFVAGDELTGIGFESVAFLRK